MKEEQWKVAHVTHDGRIVHNSVLKMQLMSEALKRGYDETAEITGYQYLETEMIYGTYVDVTIVVEGETYYIPAVVVDVKAHTRGSDGYCQTNELYKNMTEEEMKKKKNMREKMVET